MVRQICYGTYKTDYLTPQLGVDFLPLRNVVERRLICIITGRHLHAFVDEELESAHEKHGVAGGGDKVKCAFLLRGFHVQIGAEVLQNTKS